MTRPIHPLLLDALRCLGPVDHEAYGRCPRGHVQHRYAEGCEDCRREEIRTHGVLPRSHSPTVLDPEGRDVIAEDVAAIDAALSFPEDASKE